MPRPTTVLIADDEPLFVDMVEALVGSDEQIEVVGRARDGWEAVELGISLAPDVTLMDISMPGIDGIEATRRIREARPSACVLILTGAYSSSEVDRARQAGAAGFLTKDRIAAELLSTIHEIGAQ